MISLNDTQRKQFQMTKIIAYSLLVGAPIIYLIVMLSVEAGTLADASDDLMFYLLLAIAIAQPLLYAPIEKFQLGSFHRTKNSVMRADQLYFTLGVIKFSLVEASFIYGLVIYFVTGNIELALYFYPIGAIWSFVYWPREEKFKKFLEKVGDR